MSGGGRTRSEAVERGADATALPVLSRVPAQIWGVINVTEDSFSDGGLYARPEDALARGRQLALEGADVLDVGGESSRPKGKTYGDGFTTLPAAEEVRRIRPVIEGLASLGPRLSIDTVKPEVARAALDSGAEIVNDVSCGRSEALLEVVADRGAELVLMHTRGQGEVRPPNTVYADLVGEVIAELLLALERAVRVGIPRDRIWLDPGIGFAKTPAQSAALLAATPAFVETGQRVLVGPSRKSFIAELAPDADGAKPIAGDRLGGTAAAVTAAVLFGAHALRVHDVAMMRQAARLAEACLGAGAGAERFGGLS